METKEILEERGNRYGVFKEHAEISVCLKDTLGSFINERNTLLEPYQIESLHMICHKIARIINGDPDYDDSWVDIAGYAQLVVSTLRGEEI